MKLGTLKRIDLRSYWQHEAINFTKWLSEPENIALLSDEIGIGIEVTETEASVGRGDPRPEFLKRLRDCISDKGTVVVYNAKFETGVLDGLAEAFAKHAGWVEGVKPRISDLLEPFQALDYYHPGQHGSASIKAILPVLTGRSYAGLEIQEGGQASLEFLRVQLGDVPEDERQRVRERLERYCGQDTEGMNFSEMSQPKHRLQSEHPS